MILGGMANIPKSIKFLAPDGVPIKAAQVKPMMPSKGATGTKVGSQARGVPDGSERSDDGGVGAMVQKILDASDMLASNAAFAAGVGGHVASKVNSAKVSAGGKKLLGVSDRVGRGARALTLGRALLDTGRMVFDEDHKEAVVEEGRRRMSEGGARNAVRFGINATDLGQVATNWFETVGGVFEIADTKDKAKADVFALKEQQFRAERQKENKKEHPWTYGYGRDPIPGKDAFEEQADRLESEAAKKAFGGDESMDESMDEWSPPTIDFPESSTAEAKGGYGKRPDGSDKGKGYLGELKLPNGGVATEFSTQSDAVKDANGERIDFPSIVPTLTAEETKLMTDEIIPNNKAIPEPIMQKAINHANMMLEKGEGVFFDSKTDNEEKEDFALELETKDMIKAALSRSKEQP